MGPFGPLRFSASTSNKEPQTGNICCTTLYILLLKLAAHETSMTRLRCLFLLLKRIQHHCTRAKMPSLHALTGHVRIT